ncbi:MAG: sigma-70 family RNA polymerase sigma factor [Planctomycetota bacterium]|jgi:RNA polymerase sigma-70 factor (ECF subfamily)
MEEKQVNQSEEFVQLMTEYQGRLYGYILSLMCNPDRANDVLQETNVVLWQKSGEFEMGTNFKAWSFRVAHFQVMAYRQRRLRDRIVFDDGMISEISGDAKEHDELFEARQKILSECMEKLSERHRDLIRKRYSRGASVKVIAEELKQTANSISQTLFRARKNLIDCVRRHGNPEVQS